VEFIPRLVEVDGGGSYRGHDGVRSWWENLLGVWPDFRSEVDEVRDLGDVTETAAISVDREVFAGAIRHEDGQSRCSSAASSL
jgi:hypothetical protein